MNGTLWLYLLAHDSEFLIVWFVPIEKTHFGVANECHSEKCHSFVLILDIGQFIEVSELITLNEQQLYRKNIFNNMECIFPTFEWWFLQW